MIQKAAVVDMVERAIVRALDWALCFITRADRGMRLLSFMVP
jgi:hypothetical protein